MDMYDRINDGEVKPTVPYFSRKKNPKGASLWQGQAKDGVERFKHAALDELGLSNHPKADKFWNLCWNHWHANGLSEVWSYMQEFAALLKE